MHTASLKTLSPSLASFYSLAKTSTLIKINFLSTLQLYLSTCIHLGKNTATWIRNMTIKRPLMPPEKQITFSGSLIAQMVIWHLPLSPHSLWQSWRCVTRSPVKSTCGAGTCGGLFLAAAHSGTVWHSYPGHPSPQECTHPVTGWNTRARPFLFDVRLLSWESTWGHIFGLAEMFSEL